ncbi:MAG: antibiotic biosynthesis monooxygenase family protein [Halioglobus sp.]
MIGVVARIKVTPGKEHGFEEICAQLTAQVLEHEPGCLLYSVCRSQGQEGLYVTMEQYVDMDALEKHQTASYIVETEPLHAEYFAETPTIEYLYGLATQ